MNVRHVSMETAIRELRASVIEMERTYEVSSQDMLEALESGERKETAEIALWMIQHRDLQSLTKQSRGGDARETGRILPVIRL